MKKVLVFALVCLFAFSTVQSCLAADANALKLVTLGAWPQSLVTQTAEIAALNRKLRSESVQWQSDVLPDGGKAQFCDVGFLPFCDLATNRPSYRAVRVGTGAIQWYRWEPLTWKRASYHGVSVLICTSVVTAASYTGANPVEKGDSNAAAIYAWLTKDFYNSAFSDAEKAEFCSPALPLYSLTNGTRAAVGDYAALYGASGSYFLQMQDPEEDNANAVKGAVKTAPASARMQAKNSGTVVIGVRPMLIGSQTFAGGLINFLRRLFGW